MIAKIFLILLYILVLYNFIFLDIKNIYNFNINSLGFLGFIFYLIISILGLIIIKFLNINDKILKNNFYYTFKSILFLYIFLIIGFFISQEFLIFNRVNLTITKLSGNLTFLLLSLGLLISPILIFIKNTKIKSFLILSRKLLGILVFILIIRHIIDFFQTRYPYTTNIVDYYNYFLGILFDSPVVWSGTIGAIFIVFLGVTSNKISIKLLGSKMWKILHLLVFPIFFFSMLHLYFLGRIDWFYLLLIVLILLFRIISYIKINSKLFIKEN